MKGILIVGGLASLAALGAAHTLSAGSAESAPGVAAPTAEGVKVARYSPMQPDPRLPTFEQLQSDDPRFSTPVGPDLAEGHEARDAIRAEASGALFSLLGSLGGCDPIRRTTYIQAMSRYIGAVTKDQRGMDSQAPDPRWSTAQDPQIGGSLNTLFRRGVISGGDMQRAMSGASWQGRLQLAISPPPASAEVRSACPAGT